MLFGKVHTMSWFFFSSRINTIRHSTHLSTLKPHVLINYYKTWPLEHWQDFRLGTNLLWGEGDWHAFTWSREIFTTFWGESTECKEQRWNRCKKSSPPQQALGPTAELPILQADLCFIGKWPLNFGSDFLLVIITCYYNILITAIQNSRGQRK